MTSLLGMHPGNHIEWEYYAVHCFQQMFILRWYFLKPVNLARLLQSCSGVHVEQFSIRHDVPSLQFCAAWKKIFTIVISFVNLLLPG